MDEVGWEAAYLCIGVFHSARQNLTGVIYLVVGDVPGGAYDDFINLVYLST